MLAFLDNIEFKTNAAGKSEFIYFDKTAIKKFVNNPTTKYCRIGFHSDFEEDLNALIISLIFEESEESVMKWESMIRQDGIITIKYSEYFNDSGAYFDKRMVISLNDEDMLSTELASSTDKGATYHDLKENGFISSTAFSIKDKKAVRNLGRRMKKAKVEDFDEINDHHKKLTTEGLIRYITTYFGDWIDPREYGIDVLTQDFYGNLVKKGSDF
jgi:hypothetical protein